MSKATGIAGKTPDQLARAESAAVRKAKRDDRSAEEQLAILDQRPGESVRERARLTAQ